MMMNGPSCSGYGLCNVSSHSPMSTDKDVLADHCRYIQLSGLRMLTTYVVSLDHHKSLFLSMKVETSTCIADNKHLLASFCMSHLCSPSMYQPL